MTKEKTYETLLVGRTNSPAKSGAMETAMAREKEERADLSRQLRGFAADFRLVADEVDRRPWRRGELFPGVRDGGDRGGLIALGLTDADPLEVCQRHIRSNPDMPCCVVGSALAVLDHGLSPEAAEWIERDMGSLTLANDSAEGPEQVASFLRAAARRAESEAEALTWGARHE